MKHFTVRILTAVLLAAVLLAGAQVCSACSGVYVGPEASEDGSVILARSNDSRGLLTHYVNVVPRVEGKAGRTMPIDNEGTVQIEIPETTFQYTETPFADSFRKAAGVNHDAAACTNEYGVAMTMSITAFSGQAAMEADPWEEHGLTEFTADDLVICQSKTAREAVELLTSLIDQYGSSETNIALIADQKEAWYVAMYTGHQYAAVKLPADKVSVFGNEFGLEYLSDYEECITSKDLESLPKEKGFAVYGKNDELNLYDTYTGEDRTYDYSRLRTWIGHQLLAPSRFSEDYDIKKMYPLCFTPDKKVSIEDVSNIFRNRYQGTKYSPDETGRPDIRVIGSETSSSVHMLQVYPDLPADMACVSWVCSGPAVCGVFVPVSNMSTSVSKSYRRNQPAEEWGNMDTENYPFYAFKSLTTLTSDPDHYKLYGDPIRDYWKSAEQGMFAGMPQVLAKAGQLRDKEAAAAYLTSYCNDMQERAFADAKQILNDLLWKLSEESNSMQMGVNPETHEVLKEKRQIEPMQISLDPSAYAQVPDETAVKGAKGSSGSRHTAYLVMAGIALLDLIGAAVVFAWRKEREAGRE